MTNDARRTTLQLPAGLGPFLKAHSYQVVVAELDEDVVAGFHNVEHFVEAPLAHEGACGKAAFGVVADA